MKKDPIEPEKLDLRSHDIAEEKRPELLRLLPEIRCRGLKKPTRATKTPMMIRVGLGSQET